MNLTDDEINVALAKLEGWTEAEKGPKGFWAVKRLQPDDWDEWGYTPNYLCPQTGLSHIARLEAGLTDEERRQYRRKLACIFADHPDDGMAQAIHANCRQRATALLAVKGER